MIEPIPPPRILVVGTLSADSAGTRLTFSGLGEAVHRVVASAEQLEVALRSRWDVVLCDDASLGLPALDAVTALRRIDPHVPVIVVAESPSRDQIAKLTTAGATRVIAHLDGADLRRAVLGQLEEATSRRRARRPRSLYRQLVDRSNQGVMVVQDGLIMFANPAAAAMVGITVQDLLLFSADEVAATIHPDDRTTARERLGRLGRGEETSARFETRLLHRGGGVRWVDAHASPIEFEGRLAVHLTLVDITERKQAEEALRGSQEKFSKAFHTGPAASAISRILDGRYIEVNAAFERLSGFTREEAIGRTSLELGIFSDHRERARILAELEAAGVVRNLECRFHTKSGEVRTGLLSAERMAVDGEECMLTVTIDVTEQRRLEDALKRGKLEWERTFDAVRELIVITDPELRVVRLNRAAVSLAGRDYRDMIGKSVTELLGDSADLRDALRGIEASSPVRELDIASPALGRIFRVSITPRTNERGAAIGATLVAREVTVERRAEEIFRRQASVDDTEHIFRTVRHDVGNALNTLKVTLGVLRKNLDSYAPEKRQQYFDRCLESLRLAGELLSALKRYQEVDRVVPVAVNLSSFLASREGMLFEAARARGVHCEMNLPEIDAAVEADPDALMRVLLNLLDNAVAAVEGRKAPAISMSCTVEPAQVTVEVSDNGVGIVADDLGRVFAPLFTTKKEGSGMGLAIVQKLMVRMNGLAKIRSMPGEGTAVALTLRKVGETPAEAAGERQLAPAGGGQMRWRP